MKRNHPIKERSTRLTHSPVEPRGQGLVELILVVPVLIIIVVGAIDLGRVFFSVITVTNVAREGVRYLVLHPDDRLTDTTDAVCHDLDGSMQPDPDNKPQYFCTIQAARQEALATLGTPIVVDPVQITITPFCVNVVTEDFGCDRATEAFVTASYTFTPVTLLVLPEMLDEGIPIVRTAKMLVP